MRGERERREKRYEKKRKKIYYKLMLILLIYSKVYNNKFCYCINFVRFDFFKVNKWPSAGVVNVVEEGVTIPIHLIHVCYHDVLAFGPAITDTRVIVSKDDVRVILCVVPRLM